MGLVGVLVLNLLLLAVGYALLSGPLRAARWMTRATFGGVALLVGAGAVGVVLGTLAVFGLRIGLGALFVTCVLLLAAGAAGAFLVRARIEDQPAPVAPRSRLEDGIAVAAAYGVAAVLAVALVGAFRSSPWLDDTWFFWLPKGIALETLGLDARLFAPNDEYVFFERTDNPYWWSILLNLDRRFVGDVDMRAVNVQLTLLGVAFVAASARLLWGRVRPSVLWPALLVITAAPEFLRQLQGGPADIALGIYLALFALCGGLWLVSRNGTYLGLATVFGAAGIACKGEGMPQLVLVALVVGAVGFLVQRRAPVGLAASAGIAVLTLAPWYVWRAVADVPQVFSLRDAVNPAYLLDHTDRAESGARIIGEHLVDPGEWSLVVVLVVALSVAGALRERRAVWLAPAAYLGAAYLLWIWLAWADPLAEFRLIHSAYRYVDAMVLTAAVALPVLAERHLALRTSPAHQPRRADT